MTTQNPVYASQAKPWLKYYDQKFIDQTLPALSAFEYVCQRSKNHLNDTALEYYGRKFTYADLIVNVKKTAAALRGAGVKKGDIITVVSIMTPEIIALFYAADRISQIAHPLDFLLHKRALFLVYHRQCFCLNFIERIFCNIYAVKRHIFHIADLIHMGTDRDIVMLI